MVDDDPATLKLVKQVLIPIGYGVRSFRDWSAASRSIEAQAPDLVLLAVRLPGMNGFEICEKIKANPQTAEVPVLFLTGLTAVEDKLKGFQAGGVDYLTKPFERDELVARVRTQVALFRANKELARTSEALARSERRYRLGLQGSPVGVALVDGDGTMLEINRALADMVGKPAELIVGRESIASLSAPEEVSTNIAAKDRMIDGIESTISIRTAMVGAGGVRVPVRVDAVRLDHESDTVLFAFVTDLTEIEQKNRELADQAERDPLTGILNRRGFLNHVQEALNAASGNGQSCAVLFIDIDGFKSINDVYGHHVGDLFLSSVAARLIENTEAFGGRVGRLGGDEFAVLVSNCKPDEVPGIALRLAVCIRDPVIVDGVTLRGSCSVGQAVANGGSALDSEELLARADQDMYAVRRARKGGLAARVERLRAALEAGELLAYFQPIFKIGSDGLTQDGYEVLVRWRHPELGMLPPQEFIGTAEEGGLIPQLDLLVSTMALRYFADRPGATVAVNCSALTLGSPGYVHELLSAIKKFGRNPGSVILELTESVDIPDSSQIMKALNDLRREGVRIALDDFGAGYAGLNNLRTLPIDIVKIDRSVIATLAEESAQADNTECFLAGVRQLTEAMGVELLAEGIETPRQLDLIQKLRFDYVQGFLLGLPSADCASPREDVTSPAVRWAQSSSKPSESAT